MSDALLDQLQQDIECDGLLDCVLGLKTLDREVFNILVDIDEPLTVDEIADNIERERTTAYRSAKRLQKAGVVQQEQKNDGGSGYHHVYQAADPDVIADRMQRLLNDWYAEIGQLIQEFRDTYSNHPSGSATPDNSSNEVAQ